MLSLLRLIFETYKDLILFHVFLAYVHAVGIKDESTQ